MWTHITDEIEVDDIFACEAYPYPYDIQSTKYNVEYESSDPETIFCIKGILFAKKAGKATITAKLSNSELSCSKEINVIEKPTVSENLLYLSENYSSGINELKSDNPRSVATAIKSAIYEASNAGYDGIVFPKMEYNVRFDDYEEYDGKKVFIKVPSNFIIDFNDSVWNIQERADIATVGINIFQFGGRKDKEDTEGTYGDWERCENSVLRNLNIYGERYFKTYDFSEAKGDNLIIFKASTKNCLIENVYTNGTTGWVTDSTCSDYDYWTGTGNRGKTRKKDYISGKLNETGIEVVEDPTGVWYCTPEYMELGYVYGKDSVKSNEMDKYLFGKMGIVTYGFSGRWYDIYFFDSEKQLISYNPKQMGLEPYQLPENAAYFKVNVPFGSGGVPSDSGEDGCVVRLYPYVESEHNVYKNCKFINPQHTSFSMTGGRGIIIRDTYCEQGIHAGWAWAVDWEDGWLTMRHNIMYRMIANGAVMLPGSHHNCMIDSICTGTFTVSNDTEDVIAINNLISNANIQAKTNNAILYNYHNGNLNLTSINAGVNRDSNNEKISDYNTLANTMYF